MDRPVWTCTTTRLGQVSQREVGQPPIRGAQPGRCIISNCCNSRLAAHSGQSLNPMAGDPASGSSSGKGGVDGTWLREGNKGNRWHCDRRVLRTPSEMPSVSQQIERIVWSGKDPVDLSGIGPGEWSSLCVIPSYSGWIRTQITLRAWWPTVPIDRHEAFVLLVWKRGLGILGYTRHPLDRGQFIGDGPFCVDREQAKFGLERRASDSWIVLSPPVNAAP